MFSPAESVVFSQSRTFSFPETWGSYKSLKLDDFEKKNFGDTAY